MAVFGASGALGGAVVDCALEAGWSVLAHSQHGVSRQHPKLVHWQQDLTDWPDGAESELQDAIKHSFGGVQVAVFALGATHGDRPLTGVDTNDIRKALEIEAIAPLRLFNALRDVWVGAGLSVMFDDRSARHRAYAGAHGLGQWASTGLAIMMQRENTGPAAPLVLVVDPQEPQTPRRRASFPSAPRAEFSARHVGEALMREIHKLDVKPREASMNPSAEGILASGLRIRLSLGGSL